MGPVVDAETGFVYLRARYYDPATGQFLTRDTLEAVTRSAYGYVGGNPLNGSDPSGLVPCAHGLIDGGGCASNGDPTPRLGPSIARHFGRHKPYKLTR